MYVIYIYIYVCAYLHIYVTRHTFLGKVGFVMILDTFPAPAGGPFCLFGLLLDTLFEELFFATFEGIRVTAGNSRCGGVRSPKRLPPCPASGKALARTGTPDPGTPGTYGQGSQRCSRSLQDHNSMNRNWQAASLKP